MTYKIEVKIYKGSWKNIKKKKVFSIPGNKIHILHIQNLSLHLSTNLKYSQANGLALITLNCPTWHLIFCMYLPKIPHSTLTSSIAPKRLVYRRSVFTCCTVHVSIWMIYTSLVMNLCSLITVKIYCFVKWTIYWNYSGELILERLISESCV